MNAVLAVFLGAGIGGALRHGVNLLAARLFGTGFPLGTLAVNIVGSFAMGILAAWFALRFDPGQAWYPGQTGRLFLTTGLLGGFTTFSAFSLDAVLLIERGAWLSASAYALLSVIGAIAALFCGMWLARFLS